MLQVYGKKWFKQEGLVCKFCLKKGHEVSFCPAKPYVPPVEDRIPFVEHLLSLPRVSTNRIIGLSKEAALAWVKSQGTVWSEGNPWTGSDKIYDQLRGRLGFWKALGTSTTVISWLAYGVPMYFIKEPQHVIFPNHVMKRRQRRTSTRTL